MFTGLVEAMGEVVAIQSRPPGVRLVVRNAEIARDAALGDSISVNGCCLTVVERNSEDFSFDAGEETLSRTNLGRLASGSHVNLERSLQMGDRLGGHLVTGHIDAVGHLDERQDDDEWSKFWFRVPKHLTRQMASKGSVAVDGISLTLVDVEDERFSVALIPHTLQVTTLGNLQVGGEVNIETDLLAKYVERQLTSASRTDV
jgi:riboflavin synthase